MAGPAANHLPAARFDAVGDAIVHAADAAGMGVAVISFRVPEPELLFVNDAAAEIVGYGRDELTGRSGLSLVPPDELPRLLDLHEVTLRQTPGEWRIVFETVLCRRDGQRLPVEVTVAESECAGRPVVVAFIGDISRERAAKEKLTRAEERVRRLIESAPEPVWINNATSLLYANPAAARLFGYEDSSQVADRGILSLIHPDDVAQFRRRTQILLERREPVPPAEYRAVRADGTTILLEVNAVLGEYEGELAICSFGRDITERRQIEAQLLQADRLGVLGLLAGGMAHAINNPLTYVLLNIDHLLEALPNVTRSGALLGEAMTRLREAHHGAERVAAVVRRMRAFSRSSDRDAGPVELREVLESAVAMVGNEIRHRGRLVTSFESVPPVYASLARLEQVFLNLLVCAAQALPEGEQGGEVSVSLRRGPSGRVVAEVSDNGPGLDPQVVKRIYDPFATRDVPADRLALGLSLCHSIVTSIGGTIHIDSQPGRGTTFRVELPAQSELNLPPPEMPPPRPLLESEPPAAPRSRAKVMVVDDDQGVANGLRLMLEDEHDVCSVASGREALQLLLREDAYDVVFCDLMMPELSGMDLYEALRLNAPGREGRLVFMTGGAFTPEAIRFLSLVPNQRIEKPFDLESVGRLLRRAVRQAE